MVLVAAQYGIETGVRFGCNGPDAIQRDVGRQHAIETTEELRLELVFEVEVHDILRGVYPGVGAAAARYFHRLAEEGREGGFYFFLHRHTVRLALPAAVLSSIVGQFGEVAHGMMRL